MVGGQVQQLKDGGSIRAQYYWPLYPERGYTHSRSSIHHIMRTDRGTAGAYIGLKGHSRAVRVRGHVRRARGRQRSRR